MKTIKQYVESAFELFGSLTIVPLTLAVLYLLIPSPTDFWGASIHLLVFVGFTRVIGELRDIRNILIDENNRKSPKGS